MALAALVMALAGGVTLMMSEASGQSPNGPPYIIEINEEGFNPRQCNVNRVAPDNVVAFKNTGTQVHTVFRPGFGGLPDDPVFVLQPGETSAGGVSFTAGGDFIFYDRDSDFTVTVSTPKLTNTGVISCSKELPTPTPTNTPTVTPTPTPTPPPPANCWAPGCAIAVGVASDGE